MASKWITNTKYKTDTMVLKKKIIVEFMLISCIP